MNKEKEDTQYIKYAKRIIELCRRAEKALEAVRKERAEDIAELQLLSPRRYGLSAKRNP